MRPLTNKWVALKRAVFYELHVVISLEAEEFLLTVTLQHTLHIVDGDSVLCTVVVDVAVVILVVLCSRLCRQVSPDSVVLCAIQRIGNGTFQEAVLDDGWIQLLPDTVDPANDFDQGRLPHSASSSERMRVAGEPLVPALAKSVLHWLVDSDVQWLQQTRKAARNNHQIGVFLLQLRLDGTLFMS